MAGPVEGAVGLGSRWYARNFNCGVIRRCEKRRERRMRPKMKGSRGVWKMGLGGGHSRGRNLGSSHIRLCQLCPLLHCFEYFGYSIGALKASLSWQIRAIPPHPQSTLPIILVESQFQEIRIGSLVEFLGPVERTNRNYLGW